MHSPLHRHLLPPPPPPSNLQQSRLQHQSLVPSIVLWTRVISQNKGCVCVCEARSYAAASWLPLHLIYDKVKFVHYCGKYNLHKMYDAQNICKKHSFPKLKKKSPRAVLCSLLKHTQTHTHTHGVTKRSSLIYQVNMSTANQQPFHWPTQDMILASEVWGHCSTV